MKRKFLSIAVIFTLTGCSYFTPKTPIAKIAEKYTIITGVLVAPAELKNGKGRLIIYFNEQPEPSEEDNRRTMRDANEDVVTDTEGNEVPTPDVPRVSKKNILMCIASNSSNKDVLVNVREYLNDSKAQGKTIFIYGKSVHGSWQEYLWYRRKRNCWVS